MITIWSATKDVLCRNLSFFTLQIGQVFLSFELWAWLLCFLSSENFWNSMLHVSHLYSWVDIWRSSLFLALEKDVTTWSNKLSHLVNGLGSQCRFGYLIKIYFGLIWLVSTDCEWNLLTEVTYLNSMRLAN